MLVWLDSKICTKGSRVRGTEGGSTGIAANGSCGSSGVVEGTLVGGEIGCVWVWLWW